MACIVRFGNEPAVVKAGTLRGIREFENKRNAAGLAELSPLRPGAQVRFKNPALNGLEGLVKSVSSKRVAVLLELLGRQRLVNVGHGQLGLVWGLRYWEIETGRTGRCFVAKRHKTLR